jgi:choice-of-anchor B domain-containing protein
MRQWFTKCVFLCSAIAALDVGLACDVNHQVFDTTVAKTAQIPMHDIACAAGSAGGFSCSNVDLQDFVPLSNMAVSGLPAPTAASMIWGYTDSLSGKEYALLGTNNSLAIFALDGAAGRAQLVGRLPTHTGNSSWRDVRTYRDFAFVSSDSNGAHGVQIFDLRQLRTIAAGAVPVAFTESAHYDGVRNTHTIWINQATGFAYLAGTNTCGGGLHMVNINNPLQPTFAGCFAQDGYTHETDCSIYNGPDTEHVGKELCLAADVDALLIVDVSNKASPQIISSTTYAGVGYVHQASFTEDRKYVLLDDELDEQNTGANGKTYVFDFTNLDAPVLRGAFVHPRAAIDHNLYIRGNYVYESNYTSGLRVLALSNLASAQLSEVGFFDTYTPNDGRSFAGNWGNYPFFASGRVVLSSIGEGLFVVKPNICTAPTPPATLSATPLFNGRIDVSWPTSSGVRYSVQRAQGGCASSAPWQNLVSNLSSGTFSDLGVSGQVNYGYRVLASDAAGSCVLESASNCASASTNGACTAPPMFSGLASATSAGTSNCAVALSWPLANASCANPIFYNVYASTQALFTPGPSTLLATIAGPSVGTNLPAPSGVVRNYVVRAVDSFTGAEETNLFVLPAKANGPLANGVFQTGAEIGDVLLNDAALASSASPAAPVASPKSAPALSAENAAEKSLSKHVGWHISETVARTGLRSFESTIGSNYCLSLETKVLTLSAGQSSALEFWNRWSLPAAGRDGAAIEISVDGGPWTALALNETLPATISVAGNACGLPIGRPVLAGAGNTWQSLSANLASYAGRNVQIRFLIATGSNVPAGLTGWFVDDIRITNAQVPGPCVAEQLFANGLE